MLGHQPDGVIEVVVADLAFLERPHPEFPFDIVAAAERQHHRQRDLAFAEIVADVLAELCRLAAVVEHVVDELESDPEVHAEAGRRRFFRFRTLAEHRADFAGGGEQFGGLAADDREVFVLGGGGVLRRRELHDLAFRDRGGSRRQDVERAQRADFDHHAKRLPEQEVADQNAGLVAPHHARGQLAAAQFALVDHVVVQQGRGVHEFHRSRELDVTLAGIAGEVGHRQRQHRTQPLAAGRDQVVRDLRDHRDFRSGPRQDGGVDAVHVGGDEFDELVDGAGRVAFEWDNDRQAEDLRLLRYPRHLRRLQ